MDNMKHVSIRMDAELLDKFYYAAKYNGRSGSSQITYLMKSFVSDFEKEYGTITEEDIEKTLKRKRK